MEGYALSPTGEEIPVKMWECDTVTQAKEKILDAIYKVFHILTIHAQYSYIHTMCEPHQCKIHQSSASRWLCCASIKFHCNYI